MTDIPELLERFRRGPELVATVMTGAAGSELDFQPGPEKWSIRQIVAHVADSEVVGAMRFRQIIAEDNPTLIAYDEKAWTRNLNYGRRKTSESLETFRRIRAENYELLKDLSQETFARTCVHTERGVQTLRDILVTYAEHAERHARQLRDVRDAYRQSRGTAGAGAH
jgi:hypothetical protein